MADLSISGVSKTYGSGVHALYPTDLEVKNGQLVVLVGPSGCGKSTLLKILAGLEQATGGTIRIDGAAVDHVPPKARDVAMVFQNYALYPHLTVRDNLAFGLKMRGVSAPERRAEVQAIAELLQLSDLLDRRPAELSGGQQQRVAVGRAIVRRPKVFLLDEPFSNLDATLRAGTRTELLKLHRQLNATTILVTHDQVEAMTMADVLVVMKDGRVQQIGPPLEVYRQPSNQFVAQFIGFPPMNLLQVTAAGSTLEVAGQRFRNPFPATPDGTRLSLGLRAEHIRLLSSGSPTVDEIVLPARLALLEPLGNETLATCAIGAQDVILRLPAAAVLLPDQDIQLALNLREAVWFSPATGERIFGAPSLQAGARNALDKVALQN